MQVAGHARPADLLLDDVVDVRFRREQRSLIRECVDDRLHSRFVGDRFHRGIRSRRFADRLAELLQVLESVVVEPDVLVAVAGLLHERRDRARGLVGLAVEDRREDETAPGRDRGVRLLHPRAAAFHFGEREHRQRDDQHRRTWSLRRFLDEFDVVRETGRGSGGFRRARGRRSRWRGGRIAVGPEDR